jgi:hypothetical protein
MSLKDSTVATYAGVNLTTLAPDIVATILIEVLANRTTLLGRVVNLPAWWVGQRVTVNYSNCLCRAPVSGGMVLCRRSSTRNSHRALG